MKTLEKAEMLERSKVRPLPCVLCLFASQASTHMVPACPDMHDAMLNHLLLLPVVLKYPVLLRYLVLQVMRVLCEAQILHAVDHPFLASLWGTISTPTHLHFLMEPCSGGELYAVLNAQPHKRFPEPTMRFYAAEVGRFTVMSSASLMPWCCRCLADTLASVAGALGARVPPPPGLCVQGPEGKCPVMLRRVAHVAACMVCQRPRAASFVSCTCSG